MSFVLSLLAGGRSILARFPWYGWVIAAMTVAMLLQNTSLRRADHRIASAHDALAASESARAIDRKSLSDTINALDAQSDKVAAFAKTAQDARQGALKAVNASTLTNSRISALADRLARPAPVIDAKDKTPDAVMRADGGEI